MRETSELSRADLTRARLLEAAVTAFAEKGFHGTTTRDIAAAAGMSPAALYVHHKSKEELLYLISRAGHERTLALIRTAAASSDDPVEQLRQVVHDFVVYHARERTTARIVNYELAALSPEHLREIRHTRQQIEHEIRSLLEAGLAAGRFDTPSPRMAAVAVLSLGIDIARWYTDSSSWVPEDLADHYVELAMRIAGATRP